ncbi:MAG TPA: hypothetical protein VGM06_01515 [Polyangiaceae bacterium]|jgi:hypothetical protein
MTNRALACWILCVALLVGPSKEASATGEFVLLVNQANPVTSISHQALKKAATGGTKQWDAGAVVQLGVIPSPDAPETQFLAELIDLAPRELLSRVQNQVFKGEMRRPVPLRSSMDCAALAGSNPGAICVCSAGTAVPASAHVLTIN